MLKLFEKFTKQVDYNRNNRKLASPIFKSRKAFIFVAICFLADFFTIYGPIDSIFTQNMFVTSLVTMVAVLGLDLAPSLLSGAMSRGELKFGNCFFLTLAFILSFFSVTYLRWTNIYNDFANTGALGLEAIKASDLTLSPLQEAGRIFISAMPFVSSVIAFFVNYDYEYYDRLEGHLASQENTMKDYMDKFNINSEIYDGLEEKLGDKYEEALSDIMSYDLTLLDYCKNRLALACNNPDTTRLLEYFDKEIDQIKSEYKDLDYKELT